MVLIIVLLWCTYDYSALCVVAVCNRMSREGLCSALLNALPIISIHQCTLRSSPLRHFHHHHSFTHVFFFFSSHYTSVPLQHTFLHLGYFSHFCYPCNSFISILSGSFPPHPTSLSAPSSLHMSTYHGWSYHSHAY